MNPIDLDFETISDISNLGEDPGDSTLLDIIKDLTQQNMHDIAMDVSDYQPPDDDDDMQQASVQLPPDDDMPQRPDDAEPAQQPDNDNRRPPKPPKPTIKKTRSKSAPVRAKSPSISIDESQNESMNYDPDKPADSV